jgi:hypothetical protein
MSICLAFAVAAALSTPAPALPVGPATPAAAMTASATPQAVQYVQVQYRNELKSSTITQTAAQMLGSQIRAQFGNFLSNVLRSALSHANPILGAIANMIANKVAAKLTSIPINIHPKPNVKIVAEFEATTTVSPTRSRTDVGTISTIIQCDKQQIIVLDNVAKVYTSRSFSDSLNDADQGSGFGPFTADTQDLSQQVVQPQPDDGTETIAGLVSRHELVTTPTVTGFGSAKTDYWFADIPMANACAAIPQQPGLASVPQSAAAASAIRIPLRSVQWSEMDFSGPPAASPSPSASPSSAASPSHYQDPVLETPGIAWIETTSVTNLPYDASYFDVPAGYTQATPEPSPSPVGGDTATDSNRVREAIRG